MTSSLVSEELQPTPTPSPPRPVTGLAVVGLVLAVIGIAMTVGAALRLRDYNDNGVISTILGVVFVVLSLYPLWPAILAFGHGARRAALLKDDELVPARRVAAAGREEAQIAMGYAAGVIILSGILL